MANKADRKLIGSKFFIKVRRDQVWQTEEESSMSGKEKEKTFREHTESEDLLDVVVEDLDIKKFIRLIYSLGKD